LAVGSRPPLLTGRFRKVDKSKRIPGKAGQRYYKNVGLGFKTPKEAIEGAPGLGRASTGTCCEPGARQGRAAGLAALRPACCVSRRSACTSAGLSADGRACAGHYIDKKCPFTGNVSICGRILSGGRPARPCSLACATKPRSLSHTFMVLALRCAVRVQGLQSRQRCTAPSSCGATTRITSRSMRGAFARATCFRTAPQRALSWRQSRNSCCSAAGTRSATATSRRTSRPASASTRATPSSSASAGAARRMQAAGMPARLWAFLLATAALVSASACIDYLPSPARPEPLAARRPLSKTVRFNVLRVVPAGTGGKKGFASF